MVHLATLSEAVTMHDAFIDTSLNAGDCPIIFIAIAEVGSEFYYELVGLQGPYDAYHPGLDGVYLDTKTAESLASLRRLTILR